MPVPLRYQAEFSFGNNLALSRNNPSLSGGKGMVCFVETIGLDYPKAVDAPCIWLFLISSAFEPISNASERVSNASNIFLQYEKIWNAKMCLTYSHDPSKWPMYKGLKAREGHSFSLTSPSHFRNSPLTWIFHGQFSFYVCDATRAGGWREWHSFSLTCLQPFIYRPLRPLMWVCEGKNDIHRITGVLFDHMMDGLFRSAVEPVLNHLGTSWLQFYQSSSERIRGPCGCNLVDFAIYTTKKCQ